MAGIIEGMFADPNSFRNERLDDMMALQARQSQMGGSYNDLLGQVAAQGNIMGMMGAEAAAGMFGLSTPEEKKAAELQAMTENYDMNTTEGVAEFAKALNGLGYTKEAITMMDRYRTLKQDDERAIDRKRAEEDRQERIKKGDIRPRKGTVQVPKLDSKGRPVLNPDGSVVTEPKTVYYDAIWNPEKQVWERDGSSMRDTAEAAPTGPTVRQPDGKAVQTEAGPINYNTMIQSENKPVQDMWSSLRSWYDSQ